jgi:hypothetical protein
MMPFWRVAREEPAAALGVFGPLLLAAATSLWMAVRGETRARRTFAILAAFLLVGLAITAFQIRGAYVVSVFAPLVAGVVGDRTLRLIERRGRLTPESGGLAVLTLGMVGLYIALPGMLLPREGDASNTSRCVERARLRSALSPLPAGVVLAPMNLGPFILLHTDHAIVTGSYHRAPAGIEAHFRAFESEDALRRYVEKHGAAYVAQCAPPEPPGPAADFAERFAAGAVALPWLEPVDPGAAPLRVWRVAP